MRIISGKYRGKRLFLPPEKSVRPTTDRTKESLFCILQAEIAGASVLDLFSGSGALGLECLSRGAARVVFSDVDTRHVKKNLGFVGETNYRVIQASFEKVLNILAADGETFDLIFLDPPYRSALGEAAIAAIGEKRLLNADGKIIFEHFCDKELKDLRDYVTIYDRRVYGTQAISFLKAKADE
ncbi:MAG: 16S rRNA (guanine(966)-N(2))-methyltransferase RsmD [Clostridiales bacterium]|jgi:16S rRNA (guanine(966)-N(2))-methyltransferase RsmD|nr:16S rRNA (guanine(966)-N(2))-methyltransferase RsmD [Clostridiales bacterium]